jgi:hypothetical protein
MNEKSILEQALLQVQTLEEAVKSNAKGILASTMKQELNDLLKESMEDEETDVEEQPEPDEETTDDTSDDSDNEEGLDNDESDDSDDDTSNDEPAKDIDSLDSDETDFDNMDDMGNFGGNFSDDDNEDDDVVDMSNASDSEVLKVFKAMKSEDGIIVKKDGDDIEFSDGDDEYIIKLDDETEDEPVFEGWQDEISEDDSEIYSDDEEISEDDSDDEEISEDDSEIYSDDEEVVYEIELDELDVDDNAKEEEMGESARTIGNGYHAGIKSKNKYKAGNKREEINEEVSKLRKQNGEYKKALVLFKEKLNEVAVFNANLAYATRLFTESSTTRQEKLNILKRFDTISTLKESKNLYSTIKSELETKKPISESVVEKITSAPSTSSTQVLSESKAYENPQFKRMKDLMTKIK